MPGDEELESLGMDLDARNLAVTVFRTAIAGVSRVESEVLRPLGISHSGFFLLVPLWLLGPKEPRELARMQGVSVPSITSLVNTLERRGLVTRERSTVDRRLVTVRITDAGVELTRAAQAGAHRLERLFASALSNDEREAMQGYLDRYLAAIVERPPASREAGDGHR